MRDGSGRWGRVLLLGGTSELGLAVLGALELQHDAEVLLAGRDLAALESVQLPEAVRRRCLKWDAGDAASSERLVRDVVSGGDVDLVIAAAGVLGLGAAEDVAVAHEVLMTNLVGLVDVLVPLGNALVQQRHGTIVVLSSLAATRARKSNYVYGASKAGLDAFASGLADRVAPAGVKVLVVRPGFVHGRMTAGLPAAPLATTADAVGAAVGRALTQGSGVAWAPRSLGLVSPVLRLVPRALWRRLDL